MKKITKTFSEQLYDYYNLASNDTDTNLDFIFSKDNRPDLILSGSDGTVVALKYEPEEMSAPMIKTKGKNEFAKQILNLTKKNKIPVVKNDELAWKLYSKVSIDSLLPIGFYEDIATIYAKLRHDVLRSEEKNTQIVKSAGTKSSKKDDKQRGDEMATVSIPDRLRLEIGTGLVPLVKYHPSPLAGRIQNVRKQVLLEMGFTIPAIRIIDNPDLKKTEYLIKVNGDEAGRTCVNMYLGINAKNFTGKITGEETRDPAFGISALWIDKRDIKRAKKAGFGVFDPVTVICTHIVEICKRFSAELIGLDEVQGFIDCVKEKYPVVVHSMLFSDTLKLSENSDCNCLSAKELANSLADKLKSMEYKILFCCRCQKGNTWFIESTCFPAGG